MEEILKVTSTNPGVSQASAAPSLPSEEYIEKACPGVLKRRDMTALFVVILFFITNVANAVAGGAAGLGLWLIGGFCFFIPCVIATAQLAAAYPYEGSLYVWTHKVFGGFLSFLVGFCAWIPCPLLLLATADLFITYLQGLNAHWLVAPWQQGIVLLVIIVFSYVISLQRQRMIQHLINMICILSLFVAALVFVAGLVWLLTNHPSATHFEQIANWNPFTSANIPLFGVITLGYLGVNLPLNMGGELAGSDRSVKRRIITGHLFWGTLIVLIAYLLATFGVLVVQGQSAGYVLFSLASTVKMALGPLAGDIAVVGIMTTFLFAIVAYNSVYARFLLVAGIDHRIPSAIGQLNRNRTPGRALFVQTLVSCLLVILIFMVIPFAVFLPGKAADLTVEVYYIGIGVATVLWAFSTLFLFLNLFGLLFRQPEHLRTHLLFPRPVLFLSALIGLIAGILAIVDTVLYSYVPPLIPNSTWWYLVTILTAIFMIIGTAGGMFASGEASWQGMKETGSSSPQEYPQFH